MSRRGKVWLSVSKALLRQWYTPLTPNFNVDPNRPTDALTAMSVFQVPWTGTPRSHFPTLRFGGGGHRASRTLDGTTADKTNYDLKSVTPLTG